MIRAISHFGFKAKEFTTDEASHAGAWLRSSLASGSPVILCVDSFEHWITCCGYLTMDRIFLVDSDNGKNNVAENGVHCQSVRTILRRWKASGKASEGYQRFYAIAITR